MYLGGLNERKFQVNKSGPSTHAINSPGHSKLGLSDVRLGVSPSVECDSQGKSALDSLLKARSLTQLSSKINTAQTSPASRRPMKIALPAESEDESDIGEMLTDRNIRPVLPDSLASHQK